MTRESILKHALALPPDQRVQLVDDLLESVIDPAGCAELTSEQQAELLRRLEADRPDPGAAIPWDDAEKRITTSR